MWLIGVDEAGLGPLLGPLVTAAVIFEAPDDAPPFAYGTDFFRAFGPVDDDGAGLVADPRAARRHPWRWAVADSKATHAIDADLLRGVTQLGLTCTGQWPSPPVPDGPAFDPRRELLRHLGAEDGLRRLAEVPWHATPEAPFPDKVPATANAESPPWVACLDRAAKAGWRVDSFAARVVMPSRLNEAFDAGLNKSEAAMREVGDLLRWADARCPAGESWTATVDRQGGRRRYGAFLSSVFPDAWVRTEEETAERSVYGVEGPEGRMRRVAFCVKADAEVPGVGWSSQVAKWCREGMMAELNAWFGGRVRGVRPTAGYPVDGLRFLEEAGEVADGSGVERWMWVRGR